MGVKYDTELPDTFYPDVSEAQRRLQGTVIMYNGQGYYVSNVTQERSRSPIKLILLPVGGGDELVKDITDKGFNNFAAFPLGFCNFFQGRDGERSRKDCVYIARTPTRSIPQGLHSRNVVSYQYPNSNGPSFERFRNSDGFAEMLRGEYPSYEEAFDTLVPQSSIAVDREYAIVMGEMGFCYLIRGGCAVRDVVAIATRSRLLINTSGLKYKKELLKSPFLPNIVEVLE